VQSLQDLLKKLGRRNWRDWFRPGSVDRDLGLMLLAFAQKEYSVENLECWGLCESFAGRRTWLPAAPGSNRHAQLCYIYTVHGTGKTREVNVQRKDWDAVIKAIETGQKNIPTNILDGVSRNLESNIGDTLSRFQFSPEFEGYKKRISTLLKNGLRGGKLTI
jgi:hypothetical protein